MKPRLFWTMLLAFILVIMLGVCGMLSFFSLTVAGIWQMGPPRAGFEQSEQAFAASLADYYITHDNSWAGLDQRLVELLPGPGPANFFEAVVVDTHGVVVASTGRNPTLGQRVDLHGMSIPIEAHGTQVGTLFFRPGQFVDLPNGSMNNLRVSIFWSVVRGFLFAGIGLAIVLLCLAVIFTRWFSRPIRAITAAAQALAAGQRDVQVGGASIRELDDLSRSFNTMSQSLANADQQRRQMTADIAHELRTPLSIIKGRLEGMQDGVYQATPDQIERLLDETALLERLIEDLRLLALAEAGQLPLYVEPIAPADILEEAQDAFAEQAAARQISLDIVVSDDLPAITVDPQRMAQVLGNLVINALRYTPAGGTITLGAELSKPIPEAQSTNGTAEIGTPETGAWMRLWVSDTGQGIAAQDLPHIFDRFWRADRSRTRSSGGAGLGLAIARQIIAAHAGRMWVESEVGQGTTINILLPVASATVPALT